jgi:hypothetical protein
MQERWLWVGSPNIYLDTQTLNDLQTKKETCCKVAVRIIGVSLFLVCGPAGKRYDKILQDGLARGRLAQAFKHQGGAIFKKEGNEVTVTSQPLDHGGIPAELQTLVASELKKFFPS